MNLTLNKDDLLNLVNGVYPTYALFNHFLIEPYGSYNDCYGKWTWNLSKLRKELNEQTLFDIYTICKNDWIRVNAT